MYKIILASLGIFLSWQTSAQSNYINAFNITENGVHYYDAAAPGQPKKPAQIAVDEAKRLGANHVVLNLRATMTGPYSNEVNPVTAPSERTLEARRLIALIKYIKSIGMTVGLRPIFFVVGPNGEFPYSEKMPDGSVKTWWHGNIQPSDPNRWFESFRVFLDVYIPVAKIAQVEEFTIGAELYSMTVGIEDQWKAYPYGFPGRWLELLRYVRKKLPAARLMYDINFTDEVDNSSGIAASGGELERWRYRIVDLAGVGDAAQQKIWEDLTTFWNELDFVGIDMYRSFAGPKDTIPKDFTALVNLLNVRTKSYATQLDSVVNQVNLTLGTEKQLIFKEVGCRSVENGFIDPFSYAGSGTVNIPHQAAAYQSFFEAFVQPNWPWYKGVVFWELSVDPGKSGAQDNGFSPLNKELTEEIIKKYFR